MMANDPWMKFFLTYDPAPTMRRVKTPVLILTGSRDQQAVPAEVALQEAAFKEGGNKDVTARVVPDVNHPPVQQRPYRVDRGNEPGLRPRPRLPLPNRTCR